MEDCGRGGERCRFLMRCDSSLVKVLDIACGPFFFSWGGCLFIAWCFHHFYALGVVTL